MNKSRAKLLIIAMAVAGSFGVTGCKNWQYDVVKNGIHFKKIHQSKAGTNVGYMTENRMVQGFPCEKGWIHFKGWQLVSCQLSENFTYNDSLLPEHTWIHLPYHDDRTGYICSFPYDYELQGYLCGGSGGFKGTHTGFHDSGKLRSFFPTEDVIVDGVPCEASLFANVNLYENGKIKSCKLAENYQADGKTYKRGKKVEFDSDGNASLSK